MAERPLLRSIEQQEHLDEHGWVQVDLLSSADSESLLERYRQLDHVITVDRSFARGFHATIIDDRRTYRRACHELIAEVMAEPLERLFGDVVLTLTNFLHKEPGAEAVPDHVDWTFVDESAHRSISVWSPLCDTDEESGCLGVLDRSHRRVDFIRAAANPTYEETVGFGATLPGRRLIPLRAGEGIVFDHRLVHFSAPHRGTEPRVAITCELVPVGTELLHFEQLEIGLFRRHVVSPRFFITYAAGQDPRTVEGHLDDEEVEGRSFTAVPSLRAPDDAPPPGPGPRRRILIERLWTAVGR